MRGEEDVYNAYECWWISLWYVWIRCKQRYGVASRAGLVYITWTVLYCNTNPLHIYVYKYYFVDYFSVGETVEK